MKIKVLFFLFLGSISFATAQNETESKGWDEGVRAIVGLTPVDWKDIPNIYVGNLAKAWQGHSRKFAYANAEKNLFSLYGTNLSKREVSIPQGVLDHLARNKNLKAFLIKKKLHVVDEHGKIIKKMKL